MFEVIALADGVLAVRSPFLFEIGEELKLRIEDGGAVSDATARVRNHRADGVTELEILDQAPIDGACAEVSEGHRNTASR